MLAGRNTVVNCDGRKHKFQRAHSAGGALAVKKLWSVQYAVRLPPFEGTSTAENKSGSHETGAA
jgi:hypothetical protein